MSRRTQFRSPRRSFARRSDHRFKRLAVEPLEDRRMLAVTVSIGDVDPELRNTPLDEIAIEFSEPVTGFDVGDIVLTLDGDTGIQTIDLTGVAQLTHADNQFFTLGHLSSLTGEDGEYQLSLDVDRAGIFDVANGEPLSINGFSLGPELVTNGSFDVAGGGSDDLTGWSFPTKGTIWQANGDGGVARITSNGAGEDFPPGWPDARLRQEIVTAPNTTYRIDFDLDITERITSFHGTMIFRVYKDDGPSRIAVEGRFETEFLFRDNGHQTMEMTTTDDTSVTLEFIAKQYSRDFRVDNISVQQLIPGPSVGWSMDATPPVASIVPVSADPRNVPLSSVTVAFNEDVFGLLQPSDFTLSRDQGQGAGPQALSLAGTQISRLDSRTFSLQNLVPLTQVDGTYTLRLNAGGTQIVDLAGNPTIRNATRIWVIARLDFGDAPAPYPTTLADDGARHASTGPTLGAMRDEEADGQPAMDADGEDDDGVTFGVIRVGRLGASVIVNVQDAPEGAKLDAWIDFNGDGSWGGPFDQIADTLDVREGNNTVMFDVPSWATAGNTIARFRLSTDGDLGVVGSAADGEVEDHPLRIHPPAAGSGVIGGPIPVNTPDPDGSGGENGDANAPKSVFAVDLDGDGDMDVLSASAGDDKIAWYENDGSGSFTAHIISTAADGASSVFAADLDGDGDLDVLSSSERDDKIAWYENDGSQGFTTHVINAKAEQARSVFAADMDGDGDIDVLSASRWDDTIEWYENDGRGRFQTHIISTSADEPSSVFAVDIDGDGDMDVLSPAGYSEISWYENDGNQEFTVHSINIDVGDARSVFAADVDGDGDIDLLIASTRDDRIAWYENDGSENFTSHTISTSADQAWSVFAADVDGDGDVDVLSASRRDDKIAWYENDGSQGFTTHVISTAANGAVSVFAADVDGDGDLDVLSASDIDDKIAWYETVNPIISDFQLPLRPLAPTGSLVYDTVAQRRVDTVDPVDSLVVAFDAGQSVTVVIEPLGGLQAAVEFRDSGGTLLGAANSAAPGDTLVLHNVPIVDAGLYTMIVSGLDQTTGIFTGRLLLNADVESESYGGASNDQRARAQDIEPAMRPIAGRAAERGAVIGSSTDDDWYRIELGDGESTSVALYSLSGGSSSIELYDATDTRLAFDAGPAAHIGEFLDTTSDGLAADYFVRVFGTADEYNLIVTRGARLAVGDVETTLDLTHTRAALGHLDASIGVGTRDFAVGVTTGDVIEVVTSTPADGAGEFVNLLDPRVELYDPSGRLVGSDDNDAGDGRNASLTHTASKSGRYTIRVLSVGETAGEFVLNVTGHSGSLPAFTVTSIDLSDGATLREPPTRITLDFSSALRLDSVDAADLSVGGQPATGVTVMDGATLRFDLPAVGEGVHEVAISGGSLRSLSGVPLLFFGLQFEVDRSGPRVVQSSILQDDVAPAGPLEYTARFDEALLRASIDIGDVSLVGQTSGAHFSTAVVYDPETFSLSASFTDLPDGAYTLTLRSGTGRIEDLLGNDLDGERHPTTTVPSGNGQAGGDFVVDFLIDGGPPRVIESSLREGDVQAVGGLTYTARFSEPIDPNSVVADNVFLIGTRVGVVNATSVAYAAGTITMTATFSGLPSDQYTLRLRSGEEGIQDLTANPLDGERHETNTVPSGDGAAGGDFDVRFTVDRTPPRIIASSILQNDVLPAGPLLYTVQFDETLLASTLDVSNVTLSGRINGSIAATQFSYDVDSSTLTLGFDVFPDDVYTLTLRSGGNRFTDLVGHSLDGERHSTTTVPSGDGAAGGDFVVDFAVEGGPPRVVDSSLREGDVRLGGNLIYTARFGEPIDPESVVVNNVVLIGDTVGAVTATSVSYTAASATLTASFPNLPSDDFTLTVRSGPDGIKDLTGSQLDGEAHPATTVPSGDGAAGGDFEVHFTVDATPPRVIASSIVQNDVLSTDSISYTAQFSEPLLAGVLDAGDVRLASQRSGVFVPTRFEYDDASFTLTLGFDNLPDDFYTLTLRSGSSQFRDVMGNLLDGEQHPATTVPSGDGVAGGDFVVDFFLDSRPPRVIESSIREGDAVTAGGLTYTARFDEPLDPASVIAANVHLVGSRVGEFAPTSVTYRESSSTLTATFPSLPIDQYVLTLRSGAGGLADRSGKPLDGERHATTTVPSGDGVPGGNFEVHFVIPSEIGGTIASDTVLPTGSGPWRVTSNLTVPAGVTLTIEPGVVMLFEAGVEVVVRGRIVAVGTPGSRIRLTSADGAKWDGIHLRDSLEDNIFAYLDIEDAQSSEGSIGAFASVLTIDNMTFAGSRRRYVRVVDASAVISNSVFPDRFGPDDAPGAGDDNTVEMINGTGIMTGGQMIIEGNTFGTTKGHNDIIDFVSPVRPAPILQVLNNLFMGTGDEMLDLGGDAYIEGNLFMHARRDEFNTSSGQTNAISTGDGAANATIVAVRNIFFDIEHIINLEENNSVVLEHNTVVGIPEDAVDPGNGIFQEYSLVNFVIVNRSSAGRGAHLEGNIVFDVPERIFGEPDTAQNGSPGPLSDIVVNNTLLSAARCGDVIGQRPGTIVDLGTNILCGDPQFVDPSGDFHLLPGSPAIGAGANGLDLGAFVPTGATLSEWITLTAKDFATFTVDGPGVVAYRFRSDGGDWSDSVSVDERIELSGLTDGLHRVEAIGQNYAGVWQDEADAVVQSWTVDSTIPHVTAEDDDYSIDEDTVLVVDAAGGVLDNDDDVGSALTAELVSGPFQGTLELNADGSLRYTPDADFFGEDTFTYRAAGGAAESDLATVTITVRPINDPPVAADDTYAVPAGETIRSDSGVILADNPSGYFRFDDELGATQAVDSSGNGHHGTYIGGVELQQPGATADASNKAIALDRSADRISLPNVLMDGMADLTVEFWFNTSDPGTHVPVSASGPGDRGFLDDNEYLLLFDDQNRVGMSTGVDVDRSVRLHWTLPSIADGQWHHYIFVRNDTDDFLELFLDGESLGRRNAELTPITVAPGGLIIGEDQDSLGGGYDSSQALNGRLDELAIFPRAFDAEDVQRHFVGSQQLGLLDNDVDVDVDAERLSVALTDDVHSGALELADDGSFTYTPLENFVGVDRFTYRASDGEDFSNVATVTIEVGPQQDATTAADDAYRATPGETLVIGAAGGVIFNDFDPHGDQLTATLLDDVAHGQLTLAADGSFIYEADADFIGSDRFTYRATDGTLISNLATVTITVKPSGTFVAGRHVFYNGSAFDGDDANVNALDDAAIATDKTALLPGEAATLANYTSFPGGITGVMIDVAELADPGDMDTGQFVFRAGNSADPSSWSLAPRPNRIFVREGAGVLGSDRITLTWPDGALQNTWLQVTLKATGDTGLTEPDVFYFGNAVGDTGAGNQADVVLVDEVDAAAVSAAAIDPAAIDNVHDLNRDARVDAADVQIVQDNPRDAQDGLRLIDLSAITPPADLTGNGFVDFEDLTILLAAWNQNVSAAEGNLVNPLGTPVNFEDLTVLLAAWTGPGPAGAPVGRRLAAAQETRPGEEPTRDEQDVERETPRQAASYGARRNARRFRSASGPYGGAPLRRLQAAAVDRALEEEDRLGVRLPSRSLRSG